MKKHLRKIPSSVLAKLKSISAPQIVVGCAVKYKADALEAGTLSHLGISLTSRGLMVPPTVLPPAKRGRYSYRNINGTVIIRNDLPKQTHYHSVEAPNWGRYDTHTVYLPYEKYPRDFLPPREIEITMSCSETRPGASAYIIAFRVSEILGKAEKHFKERLFENLNLLQENVGACGIEPATLPLAEYAKTLRVSWEILPPGTREEAIARIFHGRSPSLQAKQVAGERYDFFMSLKPKQLVYGSSGFRRYFGALLEDDLVVFENIEYGNAIYILFENWEDLSKRSRIELLSGNFGTDFERVVHRPGWKRAVRAIVAFKRKEKKKNP